MRPDGKPRPRRPESLARDQSRRAPSCDLSKPGSLHGPGRSPASRVALSPPVGRIGVSGRACICGAHFAFLPSYSEAFVDAFVASWGPGRRPCQPRPLAVLRGDRDPTVAAEGPSFSCPIGSQPGRSFSPRAMGATMGAASGGRGRPGCPRSSPGPTRDSGCQKEFPVDHGQRKRGHTPRYLNALERDLPSPLVSSLPTPTFSETFSQIVIAAARRTARSMHPPTR